MTYRTPPPKLPPPPPAPPASLARRVQAWRSGRLREVEVRQQGFCVACRVRPRNPNAVVYVAAEAATKRCACGRWTEREGLTRKPGPAADEILLAIAGMAFGCAGVLNLVRGHLVHGAILLTLCIAKVMILGATQKRRERHEVVLPAPKPRPHRPEATVDRARRRAHPALAPFLRGPWS